jgi:hypothetical protein
VRLNQTWVSGLGDYTIDVEADTIEDIQKLLALAKKTNLVKMNVTLISKYVKELEHFTKMRALKEREE